MSLHSLLSAPITKKYYNCIMLVFLHFMGFDVCYIEMDVGQNQGVSPGYRACSNINISLRGLQKEYITRGTTVVM